MAKSVFQLHGVDAQGRVLLRRQLRRNQMLEFFQRLPPCLIGMEACSGAHYRARELARLVHYNTERPHLGYRNMGRRPIETVMSFVRQEG